MRVLRPSVAVALAATIVATVLLAGCTAAPAPDTVGSRAQDIVSSHTYKRLTVEVDWMESGGTSYQPDAAALDFLRQRLQERVDKPQGVIIELSNPIPVTQDSYSTDDLRALERENRDLHPSGDTMTLWVVFATVSADAAAGGTVVGIAYAGSSCAVFAQTLEDNAGILNSRTSMEKVVVLHEVGHLMGLVNLGTPMVTPHEDAAHPGHSSSTESVMYWQVEGGGLFDLVRGGAAPDNFDADDIADLRGTGGL